MTADTPAQFAAKTARMTTGLKQVERRLALSAATTVKVSVTAAMAAAGVKNGRLRGVGKKGARVGVRYQPLGEARYLVKATGPFQLIESNTKPHRVPRQPKTGRAKKRVVVIPGVGVRAYANHPGTKGKHPWAKGVAAAVPAQRKTQALFLAETLRNAYR